jgi:dTDP-glucose 4,6-dehydratase
LGSLHPTRDFSYVADTVRGFIALAESDASVGQVINIGSNYEISIGQTAKLISEIMNVDVHIETDEVRIRPEKSEVNRLWASVSKAKMLAGWEPHYSGVDGFKRGLTKTIVWFKDGCNMSRYRSDRYVL